MKAISLKTTAIDLVGLAQTGVEYILMVRLTLGACHTPTESCVVSHLVLLTRYTLLPHNQKPLPERKKNSHRYNLQ